MKNECEMDLVELMEAEQQSEGWLERPSVWESEITQLLTEEREAKEQAAMAGDFRPTMEALLSPGRVADEMLERSRYLRSRPLRSEKKRELEILGELDAIEAQARALKVQRELGAVSLGQVAAEMADLSLAVFAVRGRYADLLRMQGERFPARAKQQDPAERKRELAEIEAFLARKKARNDNDPKQG